MRCHQLLFIVDYMKRLHFLETKKFVKILILFLTIQISSFIYNSFYSQNFLSQILFGVHSINFFYFQNKNDYLLERENFSIPSELNTLIYILKKTLHYGSSSSDKLFPANDSARILLHHRKVETGRKASETSSAQLETIFENLTASYQQ